MNQLLLARPRVRVNVTLHAFIMLRWKDNQINVISCAFIMLFHVTCNCLDGKKMKCFQMVVTAIAVTAAVTAPVLLIVGSVLSTLNG